MSADECRANVGAGVVYRPHPDAAFEDGEIVRVSESGTYVFVLYAGDRTPKATRPEHLRLLGGAR